MPNFTEIDPVFPKKIFKIVDVFSIFCLYLPLKRAYPFIWTNLYTLHSPCYLCIMFVWNIVIVCTKFGYNWSTYSEEEDEHVKILKRQRQLRLWKYFDQKRVVLKIYSEHDFINVHVLIKQIKVHVALLIIQGCANRTFSKPIWN